VLFYIKTSSIIFYSFNFNSMRIFSKWFSRGMVLASVIVFAGLFLQTCHMDSVLNLSNSQFASNSLEAEIEILT